MNNDGVFFYDEIKDRTVFAPRVSRLVALAVWVCVRYGGIIEWIV